MVANRDTAIDDHIVVDSATGRNGRQRSDDYAGAQLRSSRNPRCGVDDIREFETAPQAFLEHSSSYRGTDTANGMRARGQFGKNIVEPIDRKFQQDRRHRFPANRTGEANDVELPGITRDVEHILGEGSSAKDQQGDCHVQATRPRSC